jgi:hypothetical protein
MPNLFLREINSFRSIHPCPCGWQILSITIWYVALCILFPKKSMISGEYWSPTLLFIIFNYVVNFIPLQLYSKISILGISL